MKNKIYIFGASGFLGKVLSTNLKDFKDLIKVGRNDDGIYFDLENSKPQDLKGRINFGDIWVFLAAVTSPEECENKPNFTFNINVTKTNNLIEWLTNEGVKVIFASSDTVFSKKKGIAYDDDSLEPLGEYARQKSLVEKFVSHNRLVKVVRFSYILGHEDKFSCLVKMFEKAKTKLDIYIDFKRCVVLLDDVELGIKNLIKNWDSFDFKSVNFCGPELVNRAEIANVLKSKFYPNLEYSCTKAPENFWNGRAKEINLDFTNFSKILGKAPKSINQI